MSILCKSMPRWIGYALYLIDIIYFFIISLGSAFCGNFAYWIRFYWLVREVHMLVSLLNAKNWLGSMSEPMLGLLVSISLPLLIYYLISAYTFSTTKSFSDFIDFVFFLVRSKLSMKIIAFWQIQDLIWVAKLRIGLDLNNFKNNFTKLDEKDLKTPFLWSFRQLLTAFRSVSVISERERIFGQQL